MRLTPNELDNILDLAVFERLPTADAATVETVREVLREEMHRQAINSVSWHQKVADESAKKGGDDV